MKWLLLVSSLLCTQIVYSQSIKGFITDGTSKAPIPYATVVLKNLNNDFLEGGITDDEGAYLIKYKAGNYQLLVNFMGYKEKIVAVNINGNVTMDFALESLVTTLDEVTVVGERTTIEQLIDKKVVNVGKDLMSSGGDASTVLEQLSEVQLDQNGNVSLRGSQNVNILLNGKPSPLSNSELLMQISSNDIKQIEVITSPSAKYQANGLTGIINIITDKKVQKGMSLNTSLGVNTLGGYNARIGVHYGRSKVGYRVEASYRNPIFKNENTQIRTGIEPYRQMGDFAFHGNIYNINGGIDWFPTEMNEFSITMNYTDNGHTLDNVSDIFQNNINTIQNSAGIHSHKTMNVNSNYRHYFREKKDFLELDVQFSDNSNKLRSDFKPNIRVMDNATDNDVLISNVAMDYSSKVNDNFKLEAGLLWNRQHLDNTRGFFDDSNMTILQEDFDNTQSTFALYSVGHFQLGKSSFQAGLRGEFFSRNANIQTGNTKVNSNHNNLFPSFHLSYPIKEGHQFIVGFNRRTSRPSLRQVNPIAFQMNEFTLNQGNPNLQPEFSNNVDVSYKVNKGKLSFTPSISYRLKENVITDYSLVNEAGVNVFTYVNNGKSDALGAELSVNLKGFDWMTNDLGLNWNYEKFRKDQIGFTRDYHRMFNFVFKNQFTFSKQTSMNLTWHYTAPHKSFYYMNEVNQKVDVAIRHKILKGKGTLNLRVTDIFDTQVWEGVNSGNGFTQDFIWDPRARVTHLSFSYRFNGGKVKKRNKKRRKYESGVID